MYVKNVSAVALCAGLLSICVSAAPLQRRQGIVNGLSQSNVDLICALTYDDPQQTWLNSGASVFLNDFLVNHTDVDWDNVLDQQTTEGGTQGVSNFECSNIQNPVACREVSVPCNQFTPPAVFHIRNAISTCFGFYETMFSSLQISAINTSLAIPQIVSDFGNNGNGNSESNLFNDLAGAFGIGAGVAAAFPEITGPLSVASGIFSIASTSVGSSLPDPTLALDAQLETIFTDTLNAIKTTVATIFAGAQNGHTPSTLPGVTSSPGPNGETQDIAKFFANGKFLANANNNFDEIVSLGFGFMQQSLISTILKSQNYYIFADTNRNENDCNGITGASFINNQCYDVEIFQQALPTDPIAATTTPISASTISNFGAYNISLNAFYENAAACQSAFPDFSGKVDPNNLTTDGSYPQCFFNLPVITAADSPCAVVTAGGSVPSNLGFTADSCRRESVIPQQQPHGGPGIDK